MRVLAPVIAVAVLAGSELSVQNAPVAPAFEVASVKPIDPHSSEPIGMFTYPGGKLTITQHTLRNLIHAAYGVSDSQVSGGPRWLDEDRYDIVGKAPASSESSKFSPSTIKTPPTMEMLLMLQTLLAERFQLRVHHEMREGPAYALRVAAKGPKLLPMKNPDAFRYVGGGVTGDPQLPLFMSAENASMALLALRLSERFGRPVLDQTGLKGDLTSISSMKRTTLNPRVSHRLLPRRCRVISD